MYTVPAKVPVQAKKLIESFEKGELPKEEEEEDDEPKPQHRELYAKELAQPGTAKKRMIELEKRKLEAEKEAKSGKPASTGRLSEEMFGDFAQDRLKKEDGLKHHGAKNGVLRKSETYDKEENLRELEEENDHQHHEVFHEEVAINKDEKDSRKSRVLIVTTSGHISSILDQELVESLAKALEDADNEVFITDLNKSRDHPLDYALERKKLSEANLIVFHFRPVLHTLPANLMAWMESVLVEEFAFDKQAGKTFDNGPLKGKKSLLLVTLSDDHSVFGDGSLLGDFFQYLWPIQNGILRFVGLSVLSPHIIYNLPPNASGKVADEAASALRARFHDIWLEKPLFSLPDEHHHK